MSTLNMALLSTTLTVEDVYPQHELHESSLQALQGVPVVEVYSSGD